MEATACGVLATSDPTALETTRKSRLATPVEDHHDGLSACYIQCIRRGIRRIHSIEALRRSNRA